MQLQGRRLGRLSDGVEGMDLDLTYFIQLGIFLFLVVSLNGLYFKPFLRILHERHERTTGAREDVERLKDKGVQQQDAYQSKMRNARQEAQQARDRLKAAGQEIEAKVLSETRDEIVDILSKARQTVAKEEDAARRDLGSTTEELAQAVAGKILGRAAG